MKTYIDFLRFIVTLLLLTYMGSCDKGVMHVESNEPIFDAGVYQLDNPNLKLDIYIENDLVRYKVTEANSKKICSHQNDISTFQKWAFCWDQNATQWVFSSDVGHTYWKYDTSASAYEYHEMEYRFDKTIVPQEVREAMKGAFSNLE
ncbi:hypothetical protein ACFQ21_05290 [Ohtaekwangia kribbensis]|uniref:Lipoprotein n=1 Tax=Ohtaekwangia kribbensis TaxID=688913 RepID=A0ABW3JYP1_9BACT